MGKPSSRDLISDYIKKMFIIARIGIEENEFTEEEANQFIVTALKNTQDRIMKMPYQAFTLYCVKAMVDDLVMLEEMKRGKDDAEDSI